MPVTNFYTFNGTILGEASPKGPVRRYGPDALGSVVAAYSAATGALENTYRNKPFGGQLSKTGTAADPSFRWVGTLGYRQTGMSWSDVYVRARHYSASVGRWTSLEPLELEAAEQPGPYPYAFGSPTTVVDPSGLQGIWGPAGPMENPGLGNGFAASGDCADCAYSIYQNWFPTPQHKCNSCYAHCTACCVLTSLAGQTCADQMQALENTLRPEHNNAARNTYCGYGKAFALGGLAGGDTISQCSKKCLAKCPYRKPNPRKDCNHLLRIGPGGKVIPIGFPPSFPALPGCDPSSCRAGA